MRVSWRASSVCAKISYKNCTHILFDSNWISFYVFSHCLVDSRILSNSQWVVCLCYSNDLLHLVLCHPCAVKITKRKIIEFFVESKNFMNELTQLTDIFDWILFIITLWNSTPAPCATPSSSRIYCGNDFLTLSSVAS